MRIWVMGRSAVTTVCDWCRMAEPIAAYWRDASHANVAVHALEVTLEANGDLSAVFARARMRTKELHIGWGFQHCRRMGL